jgi:hypothetical protein
VIVQSMHIQQVKLETGGGAYQLGEQLEEARDVPAEELTEVNQSKEEAEQQLSDEAAELESTAGWQANATEEENNMRDQDDLPFDVYKEEELQPSKLQKKSQLAEQHEEVIEEVRRLMLRSARETASKEKLSRRKPAIEARKQQQQKQRRGEGGQLQRRVWDLKGSQQ